MAGGIFVDQPFHPNPKCLIFGFLLMAAYWFLPATRNWIMLPVIFVVGYVAMAWYDYLYKCDVVMKSGTSIGLNTLDSIFKPQRRNEPTKEKEKLLPNQEAAYLRHVYLFHILAVVPLLAYIGFKRNHANPMIYPVVIALSGIALLYHLTRLFYPRATQV